MQQRNVGRPTAQALEQVTVLFADLVDFTEHASRIPPKELVMLLDDVFTRFDVLAGRHSLMAPERSVDETALRATGG